MISATDEMKTGSCEWNDDVPGSLDWLTARPWTPTMRPSINHDDADDWRDDDVNRASGHDSAE